MKRIYVLLVTVCLAVLSINAQCNNQISIGWGHASHPFLGLGLGSALVGEEESSVGAFHVQYLRNISEHWAVGGTLTYEHLYQDNEYSNGTSADADNFIAVMPTARGYWFCKDGFRMYSSAAAGVALSSYDDHKNGTTDKETKTDMQFAYHVSPVAFEFGTRKVCAFLEIGFGYKGIFNAGVSFGF